MSFTGRRGPNMSAYLRGLNVQDPARDEGFLDEDYKKELEIFTNTTFYDLDFGQQTDIQAQPPKPSAVTTAAVAPVAASEPPPAAADSGLLGEFGSDLEFMADFNFEDFNNGAYTSPAISNFPEGLANIQPLQSGQQQAPFASPLPLAQQHQSHHQHQQHQQHPQHLQRLHQPVQHPQPIQQPSFAPQPLPPRRVITDHAPRGQVEATSPLTPAGVQSPGLTRQLQNQPGSLEDTSRQSAEDDKRRRNTAASARFRVKKKQREQALEKSAKEMTEKVALLESRVKSLETENDWLKTLLTKKHGLDERGSGKSSAGKLSFPWESAAAVSKKKKAREDDDSSGESGCSRGGPGSAASSSDEAQPSPSPLPKKTKRKD